MVGGEGGIVLEGVAQVFDDVGNPLSHCGVQLEASLSLFVSLTRILPSFAGEANTYLTPVKLETVRVDLSAGGRPVQGTRRLDCVH